MALIKFFIVTALISVMTFHSIAQADVYSDQQELIDNVIVFSVNKWCDMKIDSSSSNKSVQYCKAIQDEFPDCFYSNDHQCQAINQGSSNDMADLGHYIAQHLAIEFENY